MHSFKLYSMPTRYNEFDDSYKYDSENPNCYEIRLTVFCNMDEKDRIISGIVYGLNSAINPIVLTPKQTNLQFFDENKGYKYECTN